MPKFTVRLQYESCQIKEVASDTKLRKVSIDVLKINERYSVNGKLPLW